MDPSDELLATTTVAATTAPPTASDHEHHHAAAADVVPLEYSLPYIPPQPALPAADLTHVAPPLMTAAYVPVDLDTATTALSTSDDAAAAAAASSSALHQQLPALDLPPTYVPITIPHVPIVTPSDLAPSFVAVEPHDVAVPPYVPPPDVPPTYVPIVPVVVPSELPPSFVAVEPHNEAVLPYVPPPDVPPTYVAVEPSSLITPLLPEPTPAPPSDAIPSSSSTPPMHQFGDSPVDKTSHMTPDRSLEAVMSPPRFTSFGGYDDAHQAQQHLSLHAYASRTPTTGGFGFGADTDLELDDSGGGTRHAGFGGSGTDVGADDDDDDDDAASSDHDWRAGALFSLGDARARPNSDTQHSSSSASSSIGGAAGGGGGGAASRRPSVMEIFPTLAVSNASDSDSDSSSSSQQSSSRRAEAAAIAAAAAAATTSFQSAAGIGSSPGFSGREHSGSDSGNDGSLLSTGLQSRSRGERRMMRMSVIDPFWANPRDRGFGGFGGDTRGSGSSQESDVDSGYSSGSIHDTLSVFGAAGDLTPSTTPHSAAPPNTDDGADGARTPTSMMPEQGRARRRRRMMSFTSARPRRTSTQGDLDDFLTDAASDLNLDDDDELGLADDDDDNDNGAAYYASIVQPNPQQLESFVDLERGENPTLPRPVSPSTTVSPVGTLKKSKRKTKKPKDPAKKAAKRAAKAEASERSPLLPTSLPNKDSPMAKSFIHAKVRQMLLLLLLPLGSHWFLTLSLCITHSLCWLSLFQPTFEGNFNMSDIANLAAAFREQERIDQERLNAHERAKVDPPFFDRIAAQLKYRAVHASERAFESRALVAHLSLSLSPSLSPRIRAACT